MIFVFCTKSNSDSVLPVGIQLINTCPQKTFSLYSGDNAILKNIAFNQVSQYANGAPGFYSLHVIEDASKDTVLNGNLNLQSGVNYSLFVVPDTASNPKGFKYSLVNGDRRIPQYDTSRIRFFNFSNSPPVNFILAHQYGTSNNFQVLNPNAQHNPYPTTYGRSYLDNNTSTNLSQFINLFSESYIVRFVNGNDTNKILLPQQIYALVKGTSYTLYLEGVYDSTGANANSPSALRANLISQ